jgi:catechol 2,3-dioxygenase-like lactoylglutathione lyase family enzyme
VIRQLAHLCLFTDQLEAMRRFYADTLGLRFAFPLANPAGQTFGLYFDAGHSTFIEVFDRAGAQAMWGGDDPRIERGSAFRHLCFEVTGLDALRSQLVAKGLSVSEPSLGMDGSRQAWTADPDGNPIELMEYTAASAQLRRGA